MKQGYLGAAAVMLSMLACSALSPAAAPQPGLETIVAQTFEALTQTIPAQPEVPSPAPAAETPLPPSGTTVAVNNISFVIPTGLGSGAQAEHHEAVPASEDFPSWEYGPAYDRYLIQTYALTGTFHEAAIIVYPANEFAQIVPEVGTLIKSLSDITSAPGQPLPDHLPFLPPFNAAQIFHSNEQVLAFQNGTGLRYLTQYGQAPMPANNEEVFYTYQGLTADGQFYVSVILPVNAAFLPANGSPDTPLPADGVPFDWNNFENGQQHFDMVTEKLNATAPDAFTPSLTALDALITSINIKP